MTLPAAQISTGDRFDLADENCHGYVVEIVADDDGDPAIAVIERDDGKFQNIRLSDIQPAMVTLQ